MNHTGFDPSICKQAKYKKEPQMAIPDILTYLLYLSSEVNR